MFLMPCTETQQHTYSDLPPLVMYTLSIFRYMASIDLNTDLVLFARRRGRKTVPSDRCSSSADTSRS